MPSSARARIPRTYTVRQCVADWLTNGPDGRSAKTVSTYREVLDPVVALIGATKLRALSAPQVRAALVKLSADRPTRTLQIALNSPSRAIKLAEANDLVRRNVAALVSVPVGTAGRPSKSLMLEQAQALIAEARKSRLYAYIMLCLLTGCRTEEARALQRHHVELDGLPDAVPPAPPHSRCGRAFKKLCSDAGVGSDWTPRELRHALVSIMSEPGVPVEEIAHLVGHSNRSTTETVYRKELRPVISTGAEVMDAVFKMSLGHR